MESRSLNRDGSAARRLDARQRSGCSQTQTRARDSRGWKILRSGKPDRSKNYCGASYGPDSSRLDATLSAWRRGAFPPERYGPRALRKSPSETEQRARQSWARRRQTHAHRTRQPSRPRHAVPARSVEVSNQEGKLGLCAAWSLSRLRPLTVLHFIRRSHPPQRYRQIPASARAGLSCHPGLCYNRGAVKLTGQQEIALVAARGVVVGESGPPAQSASETSAHRQEDASRYCPVCSQRLESRRCKLVCNVCGYYMSCADYY